MHEIRILAGMVGTSANFGFLKGYDKRLLARASSAEALFHTDPPLCMLRLRQFGEALAEETAARFGLYEVAHENFDDLLRRLKREGVYGREIGDMFFFIRKKGNTASHENQATARDALQGLKFARQLGLWFHRTFGGKKSFKAGPFKPPAPPSDSSAPLLAEIARLKKAQLEALSAKEAEQARAEEAIAEAQSANERADAHERERVAAEALMEEADAEKEELAQRLAEFQAGAVAAPAKVQESRERAAAAESETQLDEADTRVIIDQQLRDVGWLVDSVEMTHAAGVRPQKNKSVAIAEWPTQTGPVDYMLFVGLVPVGMIEAKRMSKSVPGVLEQTKRYARGFRPTPGEYESITRMGGPWQDGQDSESDVFYVPFLFASNGHAYLRQLKSASGVWFVDIRKPTNSPRALDGFFSPEELQALVRQDRQEAAQKLNAEPKDHLPLRTYQRLAIEKIEEALTAGQRKILVEMATGTGKTRMAIALCYRLVKSGFARRILFLVDRTSLGDQATGAFNDLRIESSRTFGEIYDIKELKDIDPETDTRLHFATVQGMVHRVLLRDDAIPSVGEYDCIIVDECHRGYVLDRDQSDEELEHREDADYISKYVRVLDHFDAVHIGLTATAATHTAQIFGKPVYTYGYREAVVDNYLIDHDPPIALKTKLSTEGVVFAAGEKVAAYIPAQNKIDENYLVDDEVKIDVGGFNRLAITESFNRTICQMLAKEIDPNEPEKTLIFCVNRRHADDVVAFLREALEAEHGPISGDAIMRITGDVDRPGEKIRRYRNEKNPNIAVTVDLLTTGIDVPSICNLVFLRRVKSRILYDQMLGRATRRCEDIGKTRFRVFDAVDMYSHIKTKMRPVVVDPNKSIKRLVEELVRTTTEPAARLVADDIVVKIHRKTGRLKPEERAQYEDVVQDAYGESVEALVTRLKEAPAKPLRAFFAEKSGPPPKPGKKSYAAETRLDWTPASKPVLIFEGEDEALGMEEVHHPSAQAPATYLESFDAYVRANINTMPALIVVTQRPRELTRAQLKTLKLALDKEGFGEAHLRRAWRKDKSEDIAASIIGHVRRAALGEPLVAYEERVRRALQKVLGAREWTRPQRKWLERIGKQLVQETVVDKDALNTGQFKTQGGFPRINKAFDGELEQVLGDLTDALWSDVKTG